jgi:glutathione S-transferase
MTDLKVFTFSPAWGLRSSGPFAMKLLKWLDLAGLPFEQVIENLPNKGPKGKNPWIELDGKRIGDTELIIETLAQRSGFDIDAGFSSEQKALAHAARRMVEEHFHMIFEWEFFVHPTGLAGAHEFFSQIMPAPLAGLAVGHMSRHFKRQLHARGLARHGADVIARKAFADIDTIETLVGGKPFLLGTRPCMADVAIYGLLYPMARWPMRTPAAEYIKSKAALMGYLERLHAANRQYAEAA